MSIPRAADLSLAELAGGLLMAGFSGTSPPASLLELVAHRGLGGVVLFSRNIATPDQTRELVDALRQASPSPLPLLVAVDQEGGAVARFREPFTRFPPMARLGEVGDPELAQAVGRVLGSELAAVGVNLDFAPVLDVLTRADNPAIGRRALATEPSRVALLGTRLIAGLQDAGVAACAKHFPGHGDAALDSHHQLPVLPHTRERLQQVELPPFVAACAVPVATVMVGHLLLPRLDPEQPASLSRPLIQGLLREELGYQGVVVTDDLEMAPIAEGVGMARAAELGLHAGVDLFLVCHRLDRQQELLDALCEAVVQGRVPRQRLEESWERLARLRRLYPPRVASDDLALLGCPEHRAVAARLA
ncbi:MAG: beta-N-acetylhexosaminidase [Myxococcota bacterium]|jgi:beta-N-acetylhexosaminidase|nr:beta-N-acetylhexosaminidase [Myxococcota bacterium]